MASQEILLSICDSCTTEVRTPLTRKGKKEPNFVLPQGWLHIAANTKSTLVFELDLCEQCKLPVLEMAGKAQHVHSTSSKPKEEPKKSRKASDKSSDSSEPEDSKGDNEDKPDGLRLVETA